MKKQRLQFGFAALIAAAFILAGCANGTDGGGEEPNKAATPAAITLAAIPGVTPPAADAAPVSAITETAQYTGTVAWKAGGADFSGSAFAAFTAYTAVITLTAKAGYTLQGVVANFFIVAGADSVTNTADSGAVQALFPATGGTGDGGTTTPPGPAATYTVTFDLNGGNIGGSTATPAAQTVASGGSVTNPGNAAKAGSTFSGWFNGTVKWDFAAGIVTGNITLKAGWDMVTYTVTFDSNGGTAVASQSVASGGKAATPPAPAKAMAALQAGFYQGTPAWAFGGWYKEPALTNRWNFNTTVTENTTLYAKWTAGIDLSSQSGANIIAKAVAYIQGRAGAEYTLILGENVTNVALLVLSKPNAVLTITSVDSTERVISQGTQSGRLFEVGGTSETAPSNARLIIDGHITLQGKSGNSTLVIAYWGGRLDLQGNAKVTGNGSSSYAGGVLAFGSADNRAALTLSGNAEVSGNTSLSPGGGVLLWYADCTMSGNAKISGNTVKREAGEIYGGGVYITYDSVFTMEGGEISGNTAWSENSCATGGGVENGASFFFKGGVIKDNILKYATYGLGGGVNHHNSKPFVMSGGAQITPKAGGTITASGSVKTDTRNSLGLWSSVYPLAVYGTPSAGPAALIDLGIAFAEYFSLSNKILKQAASPTAETGQISAYTGGAPTGSFTLGKYINGVRSPYEVVDIGSGGSFTANGGSSMSITGKAWHSDGKGGLQ